MATPTTDLRFLRLQLAQEREKNEELRCELMVLVAVCRDVLEWRDKMVSENASRLHYLPVGADDLSLLDRAVEAYEQRHPEDAKRKEARS